MAPTILVTGGTGTLGRHVVSRLRAAGRDVRVLTRHARPMQDGVELAVGDLETGQGIAAAVQGIEIIVHCAGTRTGDVPQTLQLLEAVRRADLRPHLVYVSVVGADRVPVQGPLDRAMFGYFASKRAAERVVAESGLPWTTLRATQFHELMLLTAQQMTRLPVVPVPSGVRFQPVAAAEVAENLVQLALGAPVGMAPAIAGPRAYPMAEVLRTYMRSRELRRLLVPMWLPGRAVRAIRGGANLAPDRAIGRQTWETFLAEQVRPSVPHVPVVPLT